MSTVKATKSSTKYSSPFVHIQKKQSIAFGHSPRDRNSLVRVTGISLKKVAAFTESTCIINAVSWLFFQLLSDLADSLMSTMTITEDGRGDMH